MKHTRLLEIIREEIAGALNEVKKGNVELPSGTPTTAAQQYINKGFDISFVDTTGKTTFKEAQLEEEKRKKLAEKYQLDEETINEMASVVQTKKALSKLVDAGLSPKENLDLVIDVEKETLDQFRKNPRNIDGRLARVLEPDEQPNKQPSKKTGERTKGYGADFEQNFKKKSGVRFDEFTADIEEKFNKAFPGEKKFNSGLATNTTEKEAAAQIFGIEKNKPGPQADPNKPKEEKPTSTGKKERPASEPKAEKTATLTKGDDGFDSVDASDADNDKEATQNIGKDKTAKKLGNLATGKEETFNRILGLVEKYKDDKDKVDAYINKAENEYKLSKTLLDQLKRVAGRKVEV